jgi:hypothetical protein
LFPGLVGVISSNPNAGQPEFDRDLSLGVVVGDFDLLLITSAGLVARSGSTVSATPKLLGNRAMDRALPTSLTLFRVAVPRIVSGMMTPVRVLAGRVVVVGAVVDITEVRSR